MCLTKGHGCKEAGYVLDLTQKDIYIFRVGIWAIFNCCIFAVTQVLVL